jgi:hypothetical protein
MNKNYRKSLKVAKATNPTNLYKSIYIYIYIQK